MGVAGSGKSTVALALARRYGHVFLDADDFHSAEAKSLMSRGFALTDAQRVPWVERLAYELRKRADNGDSTVLAFSGLRAAHRQRLRDSGVPIRFVHLQATPSVIAARLAARSDHFMPVHMLGSQLDALQSPCVEPDVIVIDVDISPAQVLERVISSLARP
ncbi:MAG: AAA family ATPase [Lysobacter sp.]|nr:AAA family ATPase [Lysobacter sp.]